jgi:hypothetical protein
MADAEQVENSFGAIEIVDDAIITHAQPIRINALHAMMRMRVESATETVNAGLDSSLKVAREFEEVGVEVARVDLQRGCHWPVSG